MGEPPARFPASRATRNEGAKRGITASRRLSQRGRAATARARACCMYYELSHARFLLLGATRYRREEPMLPMLDQAVPLSDGQLYNGRASSFLSRARRGFVTTSARSRPISSRASQTRLAARRARARTRDGMKVELLTRVHVLLYGTRRTTKIHEPRREKEENRERFPRR